jgi:hypothetical protein
MQKLIPTIYFYLLSLIGMGLVIIGVFNAVHYVVGVTAYEKYPLPYGGDDRCAYMPVPAEPVIMPTDGSMSVAPTNPKIDAEAKEACLEGLESERQREKIKDLEEAISFTLIGLVVFSSHFYFARKTKAHTN